MNFTESLQDFLSLVSGHWILERLFLASVEFAALACFVWLAIRVVRIKSARRFSTILSNSTTLVRPTTS